MTKIYVNKKVTEEIELSELDCDLDAEISQKYFSEHKNESPSEDDEIVVISDGQYTESFPISIKTLESMLSKIKDSGANYVSLFYHTDHIGYELTGLKYQLASDNEINFHNMLKSEINPVLASKKKEIERLQAEIEEIESQKEESDEDLPF
jgi:hypothetical protein